eukprot:656516-Lingulodinium_polyedra.AAC.1
MRAEDKMLTGRQIVHMMLNFFRADQSFSTQFAFQDLALINWKGDDKKRGILPRLSCDSGGAEGAY